MADERARASAPRVVVLSPESLRPVCAELLPAALCVSVASPYEAAAELIAEPAMALVIDLRLMVPRHLRLLQIARERGVEMLAVGGIPAGLTAEDLSGVRLVARADLKAAMETLLRSREGRYEGGARSEGRRPASVGEGLGAAIPAPPGAESPGESPGREASHAEAEAETESHPEARSPVRPVPKAPARGDEPSPPRMEPPAPRRQVPPAPAAPAADKPSGESPTAAVESPRGILTPDEMAALLEDKP